MTLRIEIMDGTTVINPIVADEAFAEQHYPGAWRVAAVQEGPVEPNANPTEWLLDLGPFSDRLGAAAVAIDISTDPALVAIRSDFARRKWIDLKDPRVIAAVLFLAGQPHPELGTLAQPLITLDAANAALTAPVAEADNLALRKLYFS